MNEFAERIERDYPVRHKEKEKVNFRTWLVHTLKELGYSPRRSVFICKTFSLYRS